MTILPVISINSKCEVSVTNVKKHLGGCNFYKLLQKHNKAQHENGISIHTEFCGLLNWGL